MSSDNKTDDDRSFWQNTFSYEGNSKILLFTIISFSIIILIVFVYHLYSRFILRFHRRSSPASQNDVVSLQPKRGLDTLVIASLPTFIVGVGEVNATECSVCLSLLEEKDMAKMLPNCKHVFHVNCVDTWLTTRSTCPICRSEVEPSLKLEAEPREGPVGELDNKTSGSSSLRLDSFRRILTSSNRLDDHSRVDQDLERQ